MEVALLPAGPEDSQFVFDVHDSTMRRYVDLVWGWDAARQRAAHDRNYPLPGLHVVFDGQERVGVVQFEDRDGAVWIRRLEVLPERQSRGYGSAVVRTIAEVASFAEQPLRLRVLTVNEDARRLYERLGFQVIYTTEPHIYMERS